MYSPLPKEEKTGSHRWLPEKKREFRIVKVRDTLSGSLAIIAFFGLRPMALRPRLSVEFALGGSDIVYNYGFNMEGLAGGG